MAESGAARPTLSAQLGFVAGALASALLNLPDVLSARRLFALSAFLGAAAKASFLSRVIRQSARGRGRLS